MNIGFYSAKQGLLTSQTGLDVISNNIANVSTNGYKDLRPDFADLLYTESKKEYPAAQTGHGTKITHTDVMYKQGQFLRTNRALDFACPDDGFFAVRDQNGQVKYSKDGAFVLAQNNGGLELVNSQGCRVLDYNGNTINAPIQDGVVDYVQLQDMIGVYKFPNAHGLVADGNNAYRATASSGNAIADRNIDKICGALEGSTVDLADQMVKVIQYQRGFQANAKLVQTSDEIQTIVNNLR